MTAKDGHDRAGLKPSFIHPRQSLVRNFVVIRCIRSSKFNHIAVTGFELMCANTGRSHTYDAMQASIQGICVYTGNTGNIYLVVRAWEMYFVLIEEK